MSEKTVLVVDDEHSILNSLKRLLRKEDYMLITAGSAAEALAVLAQQEIHLVISDYRMPQMTGRELLLKVRNLYPRTVCMMMTGYSEAEVINSAMERGEFFDVSFKPWNNDELRKSISNGLAHYDSEGKNGGDNQNEDEEYIEDVKIP